ncbi:MAG: hypothetical protein LBS01_08890 [Prevotellaceae bacterium]|jgi:asparagine synthase (glutamine-hydrolysing)|nr:hypothetical protein [Prevotellaceae bacterium]
MIHTNLQSPLWHKKDNIAVRGYCFDNKNNFYQGEQMLRFFAAAKNENDFAELLKTSNGIFSVIIKIENKIFAASDRSRVYPLFYFFDYQSFIIADNPYLLLPEKPEIDKSAEQEFLLSSFTLDEKTLIKGIYQIKPSCYLCFENEKIAQKEHYSYRIKNEDVNQSEKLDVDFSAVLENVFQRLIKSARGRQIVVPLSGGYDSRLIAAMLKSLDYQNVICYTVGRENNPEYQIAKEVANKLGYKYHFIFTGDKKFTENYTADKIFQQYYKHSGALCQSFWMYEYFGVKYLYDNDLVEKDAVFVPGHSGDFLAGSHTTKNDVMIDAPQNELLKKLSAHLFTFGYPQNKNIISKVLKISNFDTENFSTSIFDDVVMKTRLAKLINNSARLYEFFGYGVRLPFWDNEMMAFFRTLPPKLKYNKFFYDNYLKNSLFNLTDISFEKELQAAHKPNPLQALKDFARPFTPKFVFRLLSKYQDDTCMNEITAPLYADLKKSKIKLNTIHLNEPYSKWYLMKVKKDLNLDIQ